LGRVLVDWVHLSAHMFAMCAKDRIPPSSNTVINSKVWLKYYLPQHPWMVLRSNELYQPSSLEAWPAHERQLVDTGTANNGIRPPLPPRASLTSVSGFVQIPYGGLHSKAQLSQIRILSSRQLPRHHFQIHIEIQTRYYPKQEIHIAYKNPVLHGYGALHRAPTSVRTLVSAAPERKTHVSQTVVVCRQHTFTTTNPPSHPIINPPLSPNAFRRCGSCQIPILTSVLPASMPLKRAIGPRPSSLGVTPPPCAASEVTHLLLFSRHLSSSHMTSLSLNY
jgi:hypothetical protein